MPALWDRRCGDCPDRKVRFERVDLDPVLPELIRLDLQMRGGYPTPGPDALSREQWLVLGVIRDEKERLLQAERAWGSLLGGMGGGEPRVPDHREGPLQ